MTRWLLIVATLAFWGVLSGWVMGLLLNAASADYVVVPSDYVVLGAHLGLLSGTIVAACAMVSRRQPATPPQLAQALLMVAGLGALLPCLAAAGLTGLTMVPGFAPRYDHLAHPRRYVLFLSLHYGWVAGTAIGTAVAGTRLWRQRGHPNRHVDARADALRGAQAVRPE